MLFSLKIKINLYEIIYYSTCFTEEATINKIINKVEKVNLENIDSKELILIDDRSADGTKQILEG